MRGDRMDNTTKLAFWPILPNVNTLLHTPDNTRGMYNDAMA